MDAKKASHQKLQFFLNKKILTRMGKIIVFICI